MPKKQNDKLRQKQEDRMFKDLLKGSNKPSSGHWRDTWSQFVDHMRTLRLKIADVAPDGNCLFRSFSDQMCGRQDNHETYRDAAVEFMRQNSDDFAPFIEGDFSVYCKKMAQDGVWGGNLELQALAMAFRVHITIHQLDAPRFEIRNEFFDHDAKAIAAVRMVHLSYHDNQHYCSVRNVDDDFSGPPTPIVLASSLAAVKDASDAAAGSSAAAAAAPGTKNERIVSQLTGCRNARIVREALDDNQDDVDAAVEYLIEMRAIGQDDEWDVLESASHASSAPQVAAVLSSSSSLSSSSAASVLEPEIALAMQRSIADGCHASAAVASSASSAPEAAAAAAASSAVANAVSTASSASSKSCGSISSASRNSSSESGSQKLAQLQAVLDSSVPSKKCACGSGKTFKACCMGKISTAIQNLRSSAAIAQECAQSSSSDVEAPKGPAKLSNKQRREQQRQEKAEAEAEGRAPSGKVKTRNGGKHGSDASSSAATCAESMRVVGI